MKQLNFIFNLLLFPFLFIGAYLKRLFTFQTGNKGYRYHLTSFAFLFAFTIVSTTTLNAENCNTPASIALTTSATAIKTGHLKYSPGQGYNRDDYYTFTAPEDGFVVIVTKDYTGNMYGYLYDDSGCSNVVKEDEESEENIKLSLNVTKDQTYKIKLHANSGDDSDYKLRLYYPNADLKIEKSVSDTDPSINDTITYTLKGTNLGDKKSKIKIEDIFPAQLEVVSVSLTHSPDNTEFSCTHSGNAVTATGKYKFEINDYAECTITAKVLSSGSPIRNTATISSPNDRYDPVTTNNIHFVDINVAAVNQPPVAIATVTPESGPTGTTFTFDGSSSTDDGGAANLVYTWKEGANILGTLSTFSKNDFTAGSHTIKLIVEDADHLSDETTVTIIIDNVPIDQPPVAIATVNPTSGPIGTTFTFDGTSSTDDGGVANLVYIWGENGGELGRGSTFSKSNFNVGSHTIRLTVFDGTSYDSTDVVITVTDDGSGGGGGGDDDSNCTITGAHNAQRNFCLREKLTVPGNMVTIGNTILVLPVPAVTDCANYRGDGSLGTFVSNASGYNSDHTLCPVYVDGTHPSTSATVEEGNNPNQVPNDADSTVAWAGLYWQSIITDSEATSLPLIGHTIQIKKGTGSYANVNYKVMDYQSGIGKSGYTSYSAFADVTETIQSFTGVTGEYTVADIPTRASNIPNLGQYGAWTLVLIYQNTDEKLRNFSIYDGWKRLSRSSGNTEEEVTPSGFYTPKQTPINSSVSVFTAEGDLRITGDYLQARDANSNNIYKILKHASDDQTFNSAIQPSNMVRTPDPVNNQGIDIQSFRLGTTGYDFLKPKQSSIDLKFTTKSTTGGNADTYFPSMIAFNTELYEPDICYDYAYEQYGRYFTEKNNGNQPPRIVGDIFPDANITVGIYFRNQEDSDVRAKDVFLNIDSIGSDNSIKYILNSTEVTEVGDITRSPRTPSAQGVHYFHDLELGDIPGKEFVYAYYKIDPGSNTEINISIDANVSYTLELEDINGNIVPIDYTADLGSGKIKLCRGFYDGGGYEPTPNVYNVEEPTLYDSQKYNLYTQVAARPWDSYIVSYTKGSDNRYNDRNDTAQWIKVDIIDAGAYQTVEASCTQRDSNITEAVALFYTDDGTADGDAIGHKSFNDVLDAQSIDKPSYYNVAVENAAYRIWHLVDPATGEDINTTCVNGSNVTDFFRNNTVWLASIGCANQCNASAMPCKGNGNASPHSFEGCLECIYPYSSVPTCSRDNFAIRPESFITTLIDDNNTAVGTRTITTSKDNAYQSFSTPLRLAAGYQYRFDINATSHISDSAVLGYTKIFGTFNVEDSRAYMSWTPTAITSAQADANCNQPADQNLTFYLRDGTNTNQSDPEHNSLENVGEYKYLIEDSTWTHVDHDTYYLGHHTGNYFILPTTALDCENNSNIADGADKVGCIINSSHNRYNPNAIYYPLYIRSHPYDINVSNIVDTQSGKNFFYMNNVAINGYETALYPVDETYAINLRGIIQPEGKDHSPLSNFVQGCYAEDVEFTYTPSLTSVTGASGTTYDLRWRETNSTKTSTDSIGLDNNTTNVPLALSRASTATYAFTKGDGGQTTLDLHINFDRSLSDPVSPADLNISAVTADCSPTVNCETNAEGISNHSALDVNNQFDSRHDMFYAKVHPSKFLYDDVTTLSVNTPVSVNVYCDLGNVQCGLYTDLAKTNDYQWFRSINHTNFDGNVSLVPQDAVTTVTPANPISLLGGINNTISVSLAANTARPHTSDIDLTGTNIWLIHNPNGNSEPIPFYRVRFIGQSGWAGEGDTGFVVDNNASVKKNRRLGW